jgi:hypothetical protein
VFRKNQPTLQEIHSGIVDFSKTPKLDLARSKTKTKSDSSKKKTAVKTSKTPEKIEEKSLKLKSSFLSYY